MESLIRGCVGNRPRGKVEAGGLLSKTGIFTNGQNGKSKNVRGNFFGGAQKKKEGRRGEVGQWLRGRQKRILAGEDTYLQNAPKVAMLRAPSENSKNKTFSPGCRADALSLSLTQKQPRRIFFDWSKQNDVNARGPRTGA